MSFANSTNLNGLTTREAIADTLDRIMSAFDENDTDLLRSGMTSDIVQDFNGNEILGFENVKQHSFGTIGPMDTMHLVTNVRIDVENDAASTARLTANALAQHYPSGMGVADGERRLLGGSKHALLLIKDAGDGLWKAKRWAMKIVWHEGDVSVMQPQSA